VDENQAQIDAILAGRPLEKQIPKQEQLESFQKLAVKVLKSIEYSKQELIDFNQDIELSNTRIADYEEFMNGLGMQEGEEPNESEKRRRQIVFEQMLRVLKNLKVGKTETEQYIKEAKIRLHYLTERIRSITTFKRLGSERMRLRAGHT
jgi:hypothetical protein